MAKAVEVAAAPADAFGVRVAANEVVVPRAALVHLVPGPRASFVDEGGGLALERDLTGLLGAVGLRRGDLLLTWDGEGVADAETLDARLATLFTGSSADLVAERDGERRAWRVRLDGPPIPAPSGRLVSFRGPPRPVPERPELQGPLAEAYAIRRAGGVVRVPRAVVVRLVDDGATVAPVRREGAVAGYVVESPILAAMGWVGETARVDGVALDADAAAVAAVRRLFSASRMELELRHGAERRVLLVEVEGPPVPPPAFWRPALRLHPEERRIRAGVRIEGDTVRVPRAALLPLLEEPARAPAGDGATVGEALGLEVADLLGLPTSVPLTHVDGAPLDGREGILELRTRLLVSGEAMLDVGEEPPRRVRVAVEGAPVDIPVGWPVERVGLEDDDALAEYFRKEGDTVTVGRIELRRMLVRPLTGRPARSGGVALDPNVLWPLLDVPVGAVLVALDGEPVGDSSAVGELERRLCTRTEVRMKLRVNGATLLRIVQVEGGAVGTP